MVEGQTPASPLPKLALLAGTHVPRGALLTCSTAPSALVALSPPGAQSSWWDKLSLDTSALQWVFLGNLGVILTGVNPFLHRDLPETPSHCPRRSTDLSPNHDPLDGLVGGCCLYSEGLDCVGDECPRSCKAGSLHLCRAGWGLYFQLVLHPEEAARCRWSKIAGLLPALTPKSTSKCFLFSSNNFR